MLNVLERVAGSVSVEDARAVRAELMRLLLALKCSAQAVAACVAVLFALSNSPLAAAAAASSSSSSSSSYSSSQTTEAEAAKRHLKAQAMVYEDVTLWAGGLLTRSHDVLFSAVWGHAPSGADALYNDTTTTTTAVNAGAVEVEMALFCVGQLSMLGFSVEEDCDALCAPILCSGGHSTGTTRSTTTSNSKHQKQQGRGHEGPSYQLSDVTKSFRVHIPSALVSLVQVLLDTSLPLPSQQQQQQQAQAQTNGGGCLQSHTHSHSQSLLDTSSSSSSRADVSASMLSSVPVTAVSIAETTR